MRDPMQELFRVALGLAEPWVVSKIEFSQEEHQLDLWLDFPAGSRFACPACGAGCGVYDTSERAWRHLNFFLRGEGPAGGGLLERHTDRGR